MVGYLRQTVPLLFYQKKPQELDAFSSFLAVFFYGPASQVRTLENLMFFQLITIGFHLVGLALIGVKGSTIDTIFRYADSFLYSFHDS
ncbi:Uncharacterised protein [Enterococcus casseliflavus]|nr:hypothetical protein SAMN04487887_101613 [Enterococcus casseliflavus]STP33480.1 Uncharacterised protein [Enterococcus casseliflavus]